MVVATKKTEDTNLTATLKYALVSDKKMALIAQMVKGKKVEDALTLLDVLPKKAGKFLYKVIKSAYANATTNGSYDAKKLYVQKIEVGRGPKIQRIRFVSRSRISHFVKYRAFVKVFLHVK
ncbi:MAG: 50S ribosomal protein L22 [candidate division SR1 bacterium]|nr:50S ribosomal protein L22 [candidate division SR1 bacterium]